MMGEPTVCQKLVSDIFTHKKKGFQHSFLRDTVCLEILLYGTLSVYSCLLPCTPDGADFRLKLCACHLKYFQIHERQDII